MNRISPRIDFAFKLIFEQHTDILMGLINAIVSEKDRVTAIEVRNPFNIKNRVKDKLSILDIKAQSVEGTWYTIEMQVNDHFEYLKRSLYYWAKVYADQIKQSQNYLSLNKVISIHLLNYNMDTISDSYHHVYRIRNDESHEVLTDLLELHYVELKKVPEDMTQIKTTLDRWVALLAKGEDYTSETLPKELGSDELVKKAMTIFETIHLSDEEWEVYEGHLKWFRDQASILQKKEVTAIKKGEEIGLKKGKAIGLKKGRSEGEAIGLKKGRSEGESIGLEKGEAIGLEKGRSEGESLGSQKTKEDMAIKLHETGMANQQIATITGLSIEAVEQHINRRL